MHTMSINELHASIHMPDAPKGDAIHQLPPSCIQEVYKVDDYPACPVTWKHGSGKASSYFMAIEPGKHLWLDFNHNWNHSHHVAIVCSVQGLNPMTGQFIEELKLQQYRDKCPIHNEEFGADRFCQKCHETDGLPSKWPPQNYMTTVSHHRGLLWIDGWYADDEIIDGFLVTEETMRGIASQAEKLEHNKDKERVFAIGIAYYLSKEPKPVQVSRNIIRKSWSGISGQSVKSKYVQTAAYGSLHSNSLSLNHSVPPSLSCSLDDSSPLVGSRMCCDEDEQILGSSYNESLPVEEIKQLEIAGGAKIRQQLCWLDPSDLSYYRDEPEGLIYINYCTKEDLNKILKAGKKPKVKSGFTSGMAVGN